MKLKWKIAFVSLVSLTLLVSILLSSRMPSGQDEMVKFAISCLLILVGTVHILISDFILKDVKQNYALEYERTGRGVYKRQIENFNNPSIKLLFKVVPIVLALTGLVNVVKILAPVF